MSRAPLDILEEAIEEAGAAYRWYRSRSPAAGTRFLEEPDRGIEAVAEDELIARARGEGQVR